ncbi:MAG: glutathione S-transferase, partial [Pseudomonadota bacterium]
VKDTLKAEFAKSADTLAAQLDGPYLIGNALTIPDILACHCINWSIGAKFPRINDRLFAYAKDLRERPAFQAAAAR